MKTGPDFILTCFMFSVFSKSTFCQYNINSGSADVPWNLSCFPPHENQRYFHSRVQFA